MKKEDHSSQEMFDSLVKNAVDFFDQSVEELKDKPKHSVIDFCAAVELFLKARLMFEHWALVVERPDIADINNFAKGDFKSAGAEAIIKRLQGIARVTIPQDAKDTFTQLRQHRNKLVHFYNPAYETPDAKMLQQVAIEQCRGWFYLHQLLTKDWKSAFVNHQDAIEGLHSLMKQHHNFLEAKYESLRLIIEARKNGGQCFCHCKSCELEAGLQEKIEAELYSIQCLVCESQYREWKENCPNCGHIIGIYEDGEGLCSSCKQSIDLDYLLDKYFPDMEYTRVHCRTCEYPLNSVGPIGEIAVCFRCLDTFDEIGNCEYCSEPMVGDTDGSFLHGCHLCDGRLGNLKD